MIKVAILGATGYTGTELARLLYAHPAVKIVFLSSESHAGSSFSAVHPQFLGQIDLKLNNMQLDAIPAEVDLVFCALPHGESAAVVPGLMKKGLRVIDLSADFRLGSAELYREWYSLDHPNPAMLAEAVYGLPELNRDSIIAAKLLANPGCYPTSILLAMAPLLQHQLVKTDGIIIDAKSGVSGAGRSPKQAFHFPDCTENFKAYRVASHQHTAEIEQEMGKLAGKKICVTFTPHLVPMVRGILSTIYLEPLKPVSEAELYTLYGEFYSAAPFVRILETPSLPETRYVRGSNYCDLAFKYDPRTGRLILITAIDNLVKGAAGQAVQNMNIMFGLNEEAGLLQLPL